jgi:hypothetical protein
MRPVKCFFCNNVINRNTELYVQVQKRYAHKECAEQDAQDKELRKELNNFIFNLWDGDVNFALVGKQINQFQTEYNYTLSGILGTLMYCYNIKNMKPERAQGIGIVPYYYKEARNYYKTIEQGRINSSEILNTKKVIVQIHPPRSEILKKINEIQLEEI